MTQFTHATVPLWDDLAFTVDGNGKVTAGNGTWAEPRPNAFSLPPISSCPGSTPDCQEACYVHGIPPEVRRMYDRNAAALHRVLMGNRSFDDSAGLLAKWIWDNCTEFRWHVSGDVMHERHARWIAHVQVFSGVPAWIYTRTFDDDCLAALTGAPQLTVNISADRGNYPHARQVATAWGLRLCYLSRGVWDVPFDLPEGAVLFPDYPMRGRDRTDPTGAEWWQARTPAERRAVCPPDFFGQSESLRCGVCRKCMVPHDR